MAEIPAPGTDPYYHMGGGVADTLEHVVDAIKNVNQRVRRDEAQGDVVEVARGHPRFTVATLPTATGKAGWVLYCTDGRKSGEGAGSGTGVFAYCDGSAWYADIYNGVVVVA